MLAFLSQLGKLCNIALKFRTTDLTLDPAEGGAAQMYPIGEKG